MTEQDHGGNPNRLPQQHLTRSNGEKHAPATAALGRHTWLALAGEGGPVENEAPGRAARFDSVDRLRGSESRS
jgi:hypothetical protein